MNVNEIKKTYVRFNNEADVLLTASYDDSISSLKRFINYIDTEPLILDFISENNLIKFDIESIIDARKYNDRYPTQHEKSSSIAFSYQLLKYISLNIDVHYNKVSCGYGYSNSVDDHYQGFNNAIVVPFLNYISAYLDVLLIDSEDSQSKSSPSIINNGILSVNNAGTTNITGNSIVNTDLSKVIDLIDSVLNSQVDEIESQVKDELFEYLESLKSELLNQKPKKNVINLIIKQLNSFKDTYLLGASVYSILKEITTWISQVFQ